MPSLQDYAQQSPYSDPREHAELPAALPAGVPALAQVARNVVVHYRGSGIAFPPERLAEIDSRWMDRLLAADRSRFDTPLDVPRPEADRVAGCRDFTCSRVDAQTLGDLHLGPAGPPVLIHLDQIDHVERPPRHRAPLTDVGESEPACWEGHTRPATLLIPMGMT